LKLSRTYQNPTILCIDDDEAILRYETALLERSGYAVLTASSGQRGLELISMGPCDAVLLDYAMPRMSGHQVAVEIKRVRPTLTVIFVSNSDVPRHSLALVDAFVPKLEAGRQLLPTLAQVCRRSDDARRQENLRFTGESNRSWREEMQ
jgi:DNA-binding response OmpR family regulator